MLCYGHCLNMYTTTRLASDGYYEEFSSTQLFLNQREYQFSRRLIESGIEVTLKKMKRRIPPPNPTRGQDKHAYTVCFG